MTDAQSARRRRVTASKRTDAIDPLSHPAYLVPAIEPGPGKRVGRVFGYLGLTVIWLVLLSMALFATVAALPGGLGGDIGTSPMFTRSDSWMAILVVPILLVPIFGFLTVFLVQSTFGMMLSAATLFARSLNPGYRHEQLSTSLRSVGGEAVGPITTAYTGVSLSLLPVRLTRWSKVVMIIQFNGWIINSSTLVLGYIWGAVYLFTVGWMLWPATGAAVPICAIITGLLVVVLVYTVWRRRRRFPTVMPAALEGTVYERSWPNPPAPKVPAPRKATR